MSIYIYVDRKDKYLIFFLLLFYWAGRWDAALSYTRDSEAVRQTVLRSMISVWLSTPFLPPSSPLSVLKEKMSRSKGDVTACKIHSSHSSFYLFFWKGGYHSFFLSLKEGVRHECPSFFFFLCGSTCLEKKRKNTRVQANRPRYQLFCCHFFFSFSSLITFWGVLRSIWEKRGRRVDLWEAAGVSIRRCIRRPLIKRLRGESESKIFCASIVLSFLFRTGRSSFTRKVGVDSIFSKNLSSFSFW